MGNAARDPNAAPLANADKLTWGDQIQAHVQPTLLQTDSTTGETYNPKRRWMENRIQFRLDQEKAEAAKATSKD